MDRVSNKQKLSLAAVIVLVMAIVVPAVLNSIASAGTLTQVLVRFDRMKVSTATTGTVCAKPATVGTETSVKVTFPAGYTVSTTTGNWTTSTTNLPLSATAWPGIGTANLASGQEVTFPSTDLTVGTLYCFNWTNTAALTITATPAASNSGTVTLQATGPTTIDSALFSTASISDDQIVVTATVPQSFAFSLSGNTDAIGTLSTGSVSSGATPRVVTVSTNAKNGWLVWARDANTGLNSASAAFTIASTTPGSNSTLVAGTEGYNMGVVASGSGVTADAAFLGNAAGKGGGLDTTMRLIGSSTGPNSGATLTLTNNAAINATTPAATDYTDTITVVGAGLF
jgi:hypothetical protein